MAQSAQETQDSLPERRISTEATCGEKARSEVWSVSVLSTTQRRGVGTSYRKVQYRPVVQIASECAEGRVSWEQRVRVVQGGAIALV